MSTMEELLPGLSVQDLRIVKLQAKPQKSHTATAPKPERPRNNTVVPSMQNTSYVPAMRLCFGRILGFDYKMYEAVDNQGYHFNGTAMPVKDAFPGGVRDGVVLPNGFGHICMFEEFSPKLPELLHEATGFDVRTLLEVADWVTGNEVIQILTLHNIGCVARLDTVTMGVKSKCVLPGQPCSGINVFDEPTRVCLTMDQKSVMLDNDLLLHLTNHPEKTVALYDKHTKINMFSGHTLFKYTALGKHIMGIDNIDLCRVAETAQQTS